MKIKIKTDKILLNLLAIWTFIIISAMVYQGFLVMLSYL